jgi:hypothetical protein
MGVSTVRHFVGGKNTANTLNIKYFGKSPPPSGGRLGGGTY